MKIETVRLQRRHLLLAAAACATGARAEEYPARPLRWLVSYPAGASSDFLARTVGLALGTQLGQQVVIDNRPGASGMIAAESAARAAPDGYTLWSGDNGTLIYNLGLFRKVSYDPQKDFAPIGPMASVPIMIVAHPHAPYANGAAWVEAMRKNPDTVNYATPGIGTPHNLAMEMLKERANLKATPVHYRGGAPAIQDLLGNQVSVMTLDLASAWPLLKSGKLKALGVFSRERHPALPEVPSFIELGFTDIEALAWQGIVVPSATPAPIRARLANAFELAMKSPDVTRPLREYGWEVIGSSPAGMKALWDKDEKYWLRLIRDRGISIEA